jgi:broad specificity phosphatase PhoE
MQPHFYSIVGLVRHGQTQWKAEGRTHGQSDSPLTPCGEAEAAALADRIAAHGFEYILSSPLGRAKATATILARALAIADVRPIASLAERGEGVLEGLTRQEQIARYPELFDAGRLVPTAMIPGAETLDAFRDRVARAIGEIDVIARERRVLVVTHTGVIHAILAQLAGHPYEQVCTSRKIGLCEIVLV